MKIKITIMLDLLILGISTSAQKITPQRHRYTQSGKEDYLEIPRKKDLDLGAIE